MDWVRAWLELARRSTGSGSDGGQPDDLGRQHRRERSRRQSGGQQRMETASQGGEHWVDIELEETDVDNTLEGDDTVGATFGSV